MTFKEQVEDLIRDSKILKEERDSDFELASIDKSLDEIINTIIENKISDTFEKK
jgi:hypothetical protein